jgi:hypothetical protein
MDILLTGRCLLDKSEIVRKRYGAGRIQLVALAEQRSGLASARVNLVQIGRQGSGVGIFYEREGKRPGSSERKIKNPEDVIDMDAVFVGLTVDQP